MPSWSLTGILFTIGIIFLLAGILMALINVTNPLTGVETNIWGLVRDWINPLW